MPTDLPDYLSIHHSTPNIRKAVLSIDALSGKALKIKVSIKQKKIIFRDLAFIDIKFPF